MNALDFYSNKFVARSYYQYAKKPGNCGFVETGLNWIQNTFGKESFNGKSLVDLGCGPGTSIKILSELKFADYYGIDGSEPMLEIAKIYTHGLPCIYQKIDLSKEFRLEQVDGSVDMVSICSVLNAIQNPLFALRESGRVLKKDGLLLASFVLNDTKETATIIDPDGMTSYSHSNNEIINFIYKNKMCVIGLAKYPIAVSMSPKAVDVLLLCQKKIK